MLKLVLQQDSLILMKKILESVNDLFVYANFDWSPSGFAVQALDSIERAFMLLSLRSEGFELYQCGRCMSIGINLKNMATMLNCAKNDDTVIFQAAWGESTAAFIFVNPTKDKVADFEMKLIYSRHLGMSEPECHHAIVTMPSAEFARICKYCSNIGDTVVLSVTDEGLKFSTKGDIGAANHLCKTVKEYL